MPVVVAQEAYIPLAPLGGGKLVAHVGNADLGHNTTGELATKLADIIDAHITSHDYNAASAADGIEVWSCDRVIASGAVTIARKVDDPEHDAFNFLLIGRIT
ncbi:unnamed protein product [marine sediment metagenome]|uniref:Uncharacterized protein n=1 Tax=marine sediment metagenome TaxID=412755 RepID=X1S033_9ZZZZ